MAHVISSEDCVFGLHLIAISKAHAPWEVVENCVVDALPPEMVAYLVDVACYPRTVASAERKLIHAQNHCVVEVRTELGIVLHHTIFGECDG